MDTTKIIKGVVNSGRYTVTAPIVKEDYGLYLQIEGIELPSTYEVDFSNSENSGTSVTMIGNADGVLIPSQFISSGKDIFAFLYHVGVDYGRTIYKFRIPNKLRPDRTDEEPTPEEQSVIDQAISALNTAVAQTAQDVIDADASAQSASQSAENAHDSAVDAQNYAESAQTSANNASASASQASTSATASARSASDAETARQATTSLVAEAQGYADASAQSASASANSASQAQGFAQSASASAQSASGYASNAQSYSQTASAKAQDASQSATTASQKAAEASQSASQASGYAQTAESAKTDAQTAQGLAESARDSAISAKNDAESARDEAQNLVDGISGKVEQIDSNTERIESLEDDRYKPYVTDSASGSIASFPDGADGIPLKSLVVNIDPVQDLSNGDPSPENICPISGWTGCGVSATGKNLFDEANATIYPRYFRLASSETNLWEPDSNSTSFVFRCKPNTTYTVSCDNAGITIFRIGWIAENPDALTESPVINNAIRKTASGTSTITTGANAKAIVIQLNGTVGIAKASKMQIELGSTRTDYVPYQGTLIPISWQSEAGTVYGGKLDVLSGVLRVDRAMIASYNGETLPSTWISDRDAYAQGATPTTGAQVVYKLATPTTVQLTPHEVATLLGVNNIFADTGDCAVEYRADTKLYINRLTEPDADMIADSNIVSGQYFMVGNTLYKATANIANGGQIIVGTNATRISLAQALNEINA